ALLHHQLDDVHRAFGHAVGEFLDGDGLRDRHLAGDLFARLIALLAGSTALAAAERGVGALAHLVGRQRRDEGQAAARASGGGFRRAGRPLRRRDRTADAAGATAHGARGFLFFGFELGARAGRPRRGGRGGGGGGRCRGASRSLAFAEALLGDFAGLAL